MYLGIKMNRCIKFIHQETNLKILWNSYCQEIEVILIVFASQVSLDLCIIKIKHNEKNILKKCLQ